MSGFDPSIMQDFLTESGELLGTLESDLVALESNASDLDMINRVFRALHTIKGSASFLALTNLVHVAHAAESALNAARNQTISIDRAMMDLLLEAVDVIKVQMGQIAAGEPLVEARAQLVADLSLLGEGKRPNGGSAPATSPASAASPAPAATGHASPSSAGPAGGAGPNVRPLVLGPGKIELLEFLIADLDETLKKLSGILDKAAASDPAAAGMLAEQADQLARSVEFFELPTMTELAQALGTLGSSLPKLAPATLDQALPRARGCLTILAEQSVGLKAKEVREFPTQTLAQRLRDLASGKSAPTLAPGATPEDALACDGARTGQPQGEAKPAAATAASPATIAPDATDPPAKLIAEAKAEATPEARPAAKNDAKPDGKTDGKTDAKGGEPQAEGGKRAGGGGAAQAENTIRVEVARLESLMNLVGELVLQKNRVSAIVRKAGNDPSVPAELKEQLSLAAGGLDRVTGDMQAAVMRTRLQPLDKLFGRYPRLIRDLAAKTGKKINLVIEGGETEVDKSVIEELGDPLVHLMRNSADHGLEPPEERVKAGKGDTGTITLRASHEGSHVRILVKDDGRGLARERIAKKAIEKGLATPEAIAALSDKDVFEFIFAPGFSTAEQVSDLSGRGVGMDVVRTNIQKLKGTIALSSDLGRGTTVAITIPLTVAILPAMLVGVDEEVYAVPLNNIVEIVRPHADQMSSIGDHPVMRLRDSVLPLVRSTDVFGSGSSKVDLPFALVLAMNDRRVGLMVSRLIGQQEVVVKRLDDVGSEGDRAISGATVRDDGGVSLIVDVAELVRMAEAIPGTRAA